jgi:hypothetical protein
MTSLEQVYPDWNNLTNKKKSIEPKKCKKCNSSILDYSDDGNKSCQCVNCKYYLWNHDDSEKKCYCDECTE